MKRLPQAYAAIGVCILAVVALSSCQPYGCQPGFSTPADAARDLVAFNRVLQNDPAFRGLKATAVHGHEVDVVDTNVRRDVSPLDSGLHGTFRYSLGGGISDKLRNAWRSTFAQLHPNAYNADIVLIEVRDSGGRWVMGISSRDCATL
jgi:hypothetical protein